MSTNKDTMTPQALPLDSHCRVMSNSCPLPCRSLWNKLLLLRHEFGPIASSMFPWRHTHPSLTHLGQRYPREGSCRQVTYKVQGTCQSQFLGTGKLWHVNTSDQITWALPREDQFTATLQKENSKPDQRDSSNSALKLEHVLVPQHSFISRTIIDTTNSSWTTFLNLNMAVFLLNDTASRQDNWQ